MHDYLIRRSDAISAISRFCSECVIKCDVICENCRFSDVIDAICDCKIVESEPVRHGRWIHLGDYDSPLDSTWMCSCCKWKLVLNLDDSPANHGFSYCPQCGAKMEADNGRSD